MKSNSDKCHLIVSTNDTTEIQIGDSVIKSSSTEKLLGANINNKIKHLHERCLRLTYSDKKSSYEKLLEKDGSVSIHHRNIQALAIEMLKVKHKLCPEIASDIFMERTNYHYNLRNRSDFITPQNE